MVLFYCEQIDSQTQGEEARYEWTSRAFWFLNYEFETKCFKKMEFAFSVLVLRNGFKWLFRIFWRDVRSVKVSCAAIYIGSMPLWPLPWGMRRFSMSIHHQEGHKQNGALSLLFSASCKPVLLLQAGGKVSFDCSEFHSPRIKNIAFFISSKNVSWGFGVLCAFRMYAIHIAKNRITWRSPPKNQELFLWSFDHRTGVNS